MNTRVLKNLKLTVFLNSLIIMEEIENSILLGVFNMFFLLKVGVKVKQMIVPYLSI